jgi:hypothetical protein
MNTKRMLITLFVTLCVAQALAACAPAAPIEPTAAPPAAPTATPEPADPAAVVQGFWDAMDAGDVDTAMTFIAENAMCRGSCYITGKDSLRFFVQGIVDSGETTKISDLQVDGNKVSYFWELFRNGSLQETGSESMQVQDGKIIQWENLHP